MAGTDFTVHSSLAANSVKGTKGMCVTPRFAMLEIDGDARGNQVVGTYHSLVDKGDAEGTGIILLSVRALITEVVAQDTTQSVITVATDGAASASLCTITATDNEVVGETLDASLTTEWANQADSTDVTTYCVPAGYGIKVALTTAGAEATAASTTGKFLVMVEYLVIPRRIGEL